MARRRAILIASILLALAAPAKAGESPFGLLQKWIEPSARAIGEAFRPPVPPRAVRTLKKADAKTELLAVPMPRLRPAGETPPVGNSALGYAPAAALVAAPLSPEPRLRSAPSAAAPAVTASIPASLPPLLTPPPAAGSTCGVALARLGVEASPLAPVVDEGVCGIAAPVAVAALEDGKVDFTARAIVGCDLAETLAGFVADAVQPAALRTLGARVTGLRIAASYACRNRNGAKEGKVSEHALGNAIDISAFRVGGRWIEVESGWASAGADADFLKAVRAAACGPFTTVLGPGSDAAHANHFHFDRAKRRSAGPSRGLFCE